MREWLVSGMSRRQFLVKRLGYFGGANSNGSCNWPHHLIAYIRQYGWADPPVVRTFVAQFGKAYGPGVTIDNVVHADLDLTVAERLAEQSPHGKHKIPAIDRIDPVDAAIIGAQAQEEIAQAESQAVLPIDPSLAEADHRGEELPPKKEAETREPILINGKRGRGRPPKNATKVPGHVPPEIGNGQDQAQIDQTPPGKPEAPPRITREEMAKAQPLAAMATPGPTATWLQVQEWRGNQASTDWRTAERLRNHLHMLTAQHIKEEIMLDAHGQPLLDANGQVRKRMISTLSPMQVRQLAEAASAIQRTQRLALGMSTDNIGIDVPMGAGDAPHMAKGQEDEGPIFIVEMNQNGKFVRQRPRLVGEVVAS